MTDSFVPSLREYAAQYQIDGRRLGARQVLMHPGPVNRGVELAAEVIDSPQAVIGQQVAAGVVVRMAVLYELLAGRGARPPRRHVDRAAGARMSSTSRPRRPPTSLIRGAHVLDPRAGIDEPADVLVRGGEIAELGDATSSADGADRSTARAATCSPASSTRTCTCACPGQEHKEDLDSGTRAAAAGGYVAVVAMPNTDPVVDSAPILRSLREAARREARVPVGFLASVTRGLDGEALTEMAELRDAGALGFTDDGKPGAPRRHAAQGAAVPAAVRRRASRCTRRTRRCRARA